MYFAVTISPHAILEHATMDQKKKERAGKSAVSYYSFIMCGRVVSWFYFGRFVVVFFEQTKKNTHFIHSPTCFMSALYRDVICIVRLCI